MQSTSPGRARPATTRGMRRDACRRRHRARRSGGDRSTPSAIQRQPDRSCTRRSANEDRDHLGRPGISRQILVRAEAGASGLLVVDLVLEVDDLDAENRRRELAEWLPRRARGSPRGTPRRSRCGRSPRRSASALRSGPRHDCRRARTRRPTSTPAARRRPCPLTTPRCTGVVLFMD